MMIQVAKFENDMVYKVETNIIFSYTRVILGIFFYKFNITFNLVVGFGFIL